MLHDAATLTPADLRAEIARRRLRLYELAPRVGLHPAYLGAMLSERLPLRVEIVERLLRAFEDLNHDRPQ